MYLGIWGTVKIIASQYCFSCFHLINLDRQRNLDDVHWQRGVGERRGNYPSILTVQ